MKINKVYFNNVKKQSNYFILSFIFLFSVYSLMLNQSYTSDHLCGSVKFPKSITNYALGGRITGYFMDIFYYVLNHFNISKWENAWILQLGLIITLACSIRLIVVQYKEILEKQKCNLYITTTILCLAFVNPYFVETFVYTGFELGVAILLIVLSMMLYIRKKYIGAWILLFCGVCTYQSYYVIFILLTAVYFYMNNELHFERKLFVKEVFVVFFAVSTCIVNIIITKLFSFFAHTSEIKKTVSPLSKTNIIEDFYYSIKGTFFYLNGFYHAGILMFVFCVLLIIGIIYMIQKRRLIDALVWIALNLGMLLLPYMVGLVMEGMFFPPRIIWPIFISIALQMLLVYSIISPCYQKILIFAGGVFFLCNIFQTQTSVMELYQSNTLDIEYVRMVQKNIEKYETETGNEITKVATFRNNNSDSYYKDFTFHRYSGYTYTRKMVSVDWGDVNLLNEMNWEHYEKIPFENMELEEKMSGYDSQVFDAEEQLFFDNDTLYWFIY